MYSFLLLPTRMIPRWSLCLNLFLVNQTNCFACFLLYSLCLCRTLITKEVGSVSLRMKQVEELWVGLALFEHHRCLCTVTSPSFFSSCFLRSVLSIWDAILSQLTGTSSVQDCCRLLLVTASSDRSPEITSMTSESLYSKHTWSRGSSDLLFIVLLNLEGCYSVFMRKKTILSFWCIFSAMEAVQVS